jgi:hypothetical protein
MGPKWFLSLFYVWHKPCTYLAPILTLPQIDRNEISYDPRHLGVTSSVPKTILEPMVFLTQTVHLSCITSSTISKRTESSFHSSLITKEYHRVRPKWFPSLWYVRCKRCTYLVSRLAQLQMYQIKLTLKPCHQGVPLGASKMISKPMVRLTQIVHLSCVQISTISIQTESSFH